MDGYRLKGGSNYEEWCGPLFEKKTVRSATKVLHWVHIEGDHGFISMYIVFIFMRHFG